MVVFLRLTEVAGLAVVLRPLFFVTFGCSISLVASGCVDGGVNGDVDDDVDVVCCCCCKPTVSEEIFC